MTVLASKIELWKALHTRICAGELTKAQAAAEAGISYPALVQAFRRAGLLDSVRTPRSTATLDDTPGMTEAVEAAVKALLADPGARVKTQIARAHGLPDNARVYAAFVGRVNRRLRAIQKTNLQKSGPQAADHHEDNPSAPAGAG